MFSYKNRMFTYVHKEHNLKSFGILMCQTRRDTMKMSFKISILTIFSKEFLLKYAHGIVNAGYILQN